MLATVGDLVEDVVVRVTDPVNVASDTEARILRRRGGSAANVAAAAAELGHPVRFLGQVGADPIGAALVDDLARAGVDSSLVRRAGRSGTILVLVDATGERTMLTDRGACSELSGAEPAWLDDVSTLHVPMYSLAAEPLATTTRTLISLAHGRDVAVSIDLSSVTLIERLGVAEVLAVLDESRPAVVFANRDEAAAVGLRGAVGGSVTIVKRGAAPALVYDADRRHVVPTEPVDDVIDTTGAGDAFAAGFLTADWRADVVDACRAGHRAAARALVFRGEATSIPFFR